MKHHNQNSKVLVQEQTNKLSTILSPETDLHIYGSLIYDKSNTAECWGKDDLFQ